MKSSKKVSSERSSLSADYQFSFKRYFINNLDSYHGAYILKELTKVLEKNAIVAKEPSQSVIGEDAEPFEPPPPEQPYEIIGTVASFFILLRKYFNKKNFFK